MNPTDDRSYEIDSVIRMSGPNGASSQLIANGGLLGNILTPWVSCTNSNGDSFTVQNAQA